MTTRRRLFSLFGLIAVAAPLAGARAQSASSPPSMATLWSPGDAGERLELRGQVVDAGGAPLSDASVTVWQADGTGVYTEPYRGRMITDSHGTYVLRTALPGSYGGPRHIHMHVAHDSAGTINTRVLFKGDPRLSAYMADEAIVLDETSMGGERVWIGNFDVVLGARS